MKNRFEVFTTQIAKLSRNIRKIKTEEMSEFGLKSPHVSCLYYLFKQGKPMTAKELGEACDEDKAAISRSLEFLENKNYIQCKSKNEKRYKSPLVLTKEGEQIAQIIADKIDNVLILASEGLTEDDRDHFYKSLILISDNLQKYCDKYGD